MKKILMIALVAAAFTACSNDNKESNLTNNRQPIRLGTGMVNMRSNSQTLQATELADQTTVGVYIYFKDKKTTDNTYNYGYKNIAYKVSGTVGDLTIDNTAEQPYYPDVKSQKIDIYAFAPRVYTGTAELSTLDTEECFTTKQDQTDEDKYRASDFVWGKLADVDAPAVAATKQEVKLDHMLSKININIAAGEGVSFSHLSGATIRLNGVKLEGKVNFTNGAVTPTGAATGQTVTLTTATAPTGKLADTTTDCYTSSAVIIPQTVPAAANFIEIELSNHSVYKYNGSATTFNPQKVYTYDIKLGVAGIQLTTTINDWTSAGDAITGKAE